MWTHSTLITVLWWHYYFPPFTKGKTEAWRLTNLSKVSQIIYSVTGIPINDKSTILTRLFRWADCNIILLWKWQSPPSSSVQMWAPGLVHLENPTDIHQPQLWTFHNFKNENCKAVVEFRQFFLLISNSRDSGPPKSFWLLSRIICIFIVLNSFKKCFHRD